MSGIVGSRLNIRGSGLVGNIGTDGQVLTSSGAGQELVFEDAGGGAVTALNSATDNELVTVGSTTTELDAESTLTFDGNALVVGGTAPSVTIGDAGAEDAKLVFDGNALDFHIGLDDSADTLVIGKGSALGTTTAMSFDTNGIITKPLQPAFLAANQSTDYDLSASGNVTLKYGTEVYDNNADYDTGTYTFTAPVAGRYFFALNNTFMATPDSDNNFRSKFYTSNRSLDVIHVANDVPYFAQSAAVVTDMDANDTCLAVYEQGAGSKQVDFRTNSYWSGCLIC